MTPERAEEPVWVKVLHTVLGYLLRLQNEDNIIEQSGLNGRKVDTELRHRQVVCRCDRVHLAHFKQLAVHLAEILLRDSIGHDLRKSLAGRKRRPIL